MLNAGSTFGHYNIEEVIGRGAMGVVYKAQDSSSGQVVALKLLDDNVLKSEGYRERLAQEAETAGKIDSPYVVKVREYSEFEGQPFLSLEYVSGKELRDTLDELDFERKIEIALQIGQGLKSAHLQGLIHRDLKPENIKITDEGKAKILDFGLAKTVSADSVDKYGNIEGTLYYLSPEQVSGESLAYSSDLFSFGAVLYEMFTGNRPFDGEYPAAIIYSILHEEPPIPSDIDSEIPEWCDEFIMKLLRKRPENRYENIQVVLDFIEQNRSRKVDDKSVRAIRSRQTVTVIDLKNLSDDKNWDYFCIGFTDDLIKELSRRTDLVISAEPSTAYCRNIKDIFKHCRSDFAVQGSLMKWQDKIRLSLSVFASRDEKLISGKNYDGNSDEIFEILSNAVEDVSADLSKATGYQSVSVEDYFKTDIAAYEYYLKGKNYYQTNKPDDLEIAEKMFEKALEIDPDLAYAYSGLSDVHAFQFMAYYDRSQEKIEKARTEALKALEIAPSLPEAHRSLGRYYMFIGAFNSAEESFNKTIELNPKYAIGYRTLAWLKELTSDHKKAIHWAKLALRYAPNDLETLLLLSLSNMHLAKYTVAMATLQRALELAPDYGRAYYNLGRVYLKLGVLDLAIENFLQAIKYKGDPNALIEAGYIYLVQGDFGQARKYLMDSVQSNYFPFIAYYMLGYIERDDGNDRQAHEYFQQALKIAAEYEEKDQKNPHIKAFLAMALASTGEKEKAREVLNNLKDWQNFDGEALYNIARGYSLLGDNTKANDILRLAVEKHPGPTEKELSFDPHFKKGQFFFNSENVKKAS